MATPLMAGAATLKRLQIDAYLIDIEIVACCVGQGSVCKVSGPVHGSDKENVLG